MKLWGRVNLFLCKQCDAKLDIFVNSTERRRLLVIEVSHALKGGNLFLKRRLNPGPKKKSRTKKLEKLSRITGKKLLRLCMN